MSKVRFTKTSNVQDANIIRGGRKWEALVDAVNNVVKQLAVHGLG